MTRRDWSKERWRKQYVREPLQHRTWPVMARGLRELLNALAEDDGLLVRGADDPVQALLRALHPQEYEAELVEAAIELLLADGFLERDAQSIWIPEVPWAQALKESLSSEPNRGEAPAPSADAGRRTSTERVRQFRERQRARNAPEAFQRVSPAVSVGVSSVSPSVSPSRGNREQDPSQGLDQEKDREKDHLPQESARVADVSPSVSTPPLRSVSPSVSSARVSSNQGKDEEEVVRIPRDLAEALKMPAQERAAVLRIRPDLARSLCPHRWPEVLAVASAYAEGAGLGAQCVGEYAADDGVRRIVELLAIGFPVGGLEYVARVVPKQPWWTAGGKRLGLSSLSPEVVRRNLPDSSGRARVLSPRVAKVLEAAQLERKANGAA
jgi:hypothetical protein